MSEAQIVALRIGSMEFDAWHCPRCYPNSPSSMTVLGFERKTTRNGTGFAQCSRCQERTVTVKFEQASTSKTAHNVFHYHCCGKHRAEDDAITF